MILYSWYKIYTSFNPSLDILAIELSVLFLFMTFLGCFPVYAATACRGIVTFPILAAILCLIDVPCKYLEKTLIVGKMLYPFPSSSEKESIVAD